MNFWHYNFICTKPVLNILVLNGIKCDEIIIHFEGCKRDQNAILPLREKNIENQQWKNQWHNTNVPLTNQTFPMMKIIYTVLYLYQNINIKITGAFAVFNGIGKFGSNKVRLYWIISLIKLRKLYFWGGYFPKENKYIQF